MTPIVALVLGLLAGWLVEWVIDWLYWRRRYQGLQSSLSNYQHKQGVLESELSNSRNIVQPLQDSRNQLELEKAQLEIILAQTQQELESLRSQAAPSQPDLGIPGTQSSTGKPPNPDNLQQIHGIGLVISKRLNHNGIFTFEQLAAQTPDFLRQLLGDMVQRLADEESIIEQAQQLALRKQIQGKSGQ
jgi:predicted flap endonuclease-1-like 5' DNA nuclease